MNSVSVGLAVAIAAIGVMFFPSRHLKDNTKVVVAYSTLLIAVLVAFYPRIESYFYSPKENEVVEIKMLTIVGKKFENETLEVGGKLFDGCTFKNVKFVYNGGQVGFANGCTYEFDGVPAFATKDLNVTGTVDLLKMMNLLEPKFSKTWKHLAAQEIK